MHPLQLRFGTALFLFRDVEQTRRFLETVCFRDKRGKVWLHHGCTLHEFTELAAEYYVNIPDGVKFHCRKRTSFMLGRPNELSNNFI